MRKLTEIHIKHLIDHQMELNGYKERFDDLINHLYWYHKFTTTVENIAIYIIGGMALSILGLILAIYKN